MISTRVFQYRWIASELKTLIQNAKAKTIEYLGVLMCNWLLSSCGPSILKVKVQIDKPAAIKEAQSATVITKRERKVGLQPNSVSGGFSSPKLQAVESKPLVGARNTIKSYGGLGLCEIFGVDFIGPPSLPSNSKSTKPLQKALNLTYIAIGSNLGARSRNISLAIEKLRAIGNIRNVSFLYETPPAYLTDQPAFLNCVVSIENFGGEPKELLRELKRIEEEVGRVKTSKYGPRMIDLDIIAIGDAVLEHGDELIIPHALMHERAFVLVPLSDICPMEWFHPKMRKTLKEMIDNLDKKDLDGVKRVIPTMFDSEKDDEEIIQVHEGSPIRLFGVLNATPDSFSDGGVNSNPEEAKNTILQWIAKDKSVIVDVGGESTKAGSDPVSLEEELSRITPIISTIKSNIISNTALPRTLISIDTSKLEIAKIAIEKFGCNILNDVQAVSRFYADRAEHDRICELVKQSRVPWIVMHSRGKPKEMKSLATYDTGSVVSQVTREMLPVIRSILESGVLPWQLIVDPGIGFAKTGEQNAEILRGLDQFKLSLGHLPVLIGASRKRFIGTLVDREADEPKTRDLPGLALIPPIVSAGCSFIRTHDIISSKEILMVYEKIWSRY